MINLSEGAITFSVLDTKVVYLSSCKNLWYTQYVRNSNTNVMRLDYNRFIGYQIILHFLYVKNM